MIRQIGNEDFRDRIISFRSFLDSPMPSQWKSYQLQIRHHKHCTIQMFHLIARHTENAKQRQTDYSHLI
jgi:hypothetical protein